MRKLVLFLFWICVACGVKPDDHQNLTVFTRLRAPETGIHFQNNLSVQDDFDVFRYRNFYNGGGVAIADFDNDGKPDVYLISNMGANHLYHNLGSWKFEEIAGKAGVQGKKVWSTGVSIADVNADGLLDIYVCNAGDVNGGNRENELFINNGNLTFTDSAAFYGLNDKGFGTHAAFFDYDRDGDLDCYVLNNSYRPVASLGYRNLRNERDEFGGHKLYRNDHNRFIDVSEEAGIYGSVIGFGLGITVGDVNQDGWPDLYVSNDFYERDYLYINLQNGKFEEKVEDFMGHISMFSMGADMADINNDGYPDIFSTDMLPEKDQRLKTLVAFETYDVYQLRLKNGYYHQFMRNMLHLNTRNGNFIDVGELAGVAATDWSWSALITDFNNDQFKEIFVSNGIYKDVINQDFVEYLGGTDQMKAAFEGKKVDFQNFVDQMPSNKLSNYLFERKSKLQYVNNAIKYGLDEPSFSSGAAYGDLDNDGDLDLIVNNVNQELFVYRNNTSEQTTNQHLTIKFKGYKKNTFGLGTIVRAYVNNQILTFDHMPIRGFQSSMDYKMVIGLGQNKTIDSLILKWPDQRVQIFRNIDANQHILADYSLAIEPNLVNDNKKPLFNLVNETDIKHVENNFNDFDRDRLQYHMLSTQGPAFAKGDLNQDGLDDVFIGGSVGQASKIFIQNGEGVFSEFISEIFKVDSLSEDTDATFFDADQDGDLDLFVVTGGSEYMGQTTHNLDRLYFNIGSKLKPEFKKSDKVLPAIYNSGSCVREADFDNDGDLDLFIGTRVIPGYYGMPCSQHLLENDGNGNFSDVTKSLAPELLNLGMVTDATWTDYDADGYLDLIVVGEWMPIMVFRNQGNKLTIVKNISGLQKSNGWWNTIKSSDLDADGDLDFIVGNYGLNSKFKPNENNPILLYVNDFDKNGSQEPIFAFIDKGQEYPMALRQDIIKQMSSLKKKFVYYKDYADKTLIDIFDQQLLNNAIRLEFNQPNSSVLINNKNGFELKPLPIEAQVAPVYGITSINLNDDNFPDLILGGNLFSVKPEVGRLDALHGLTLLGKGNGEFLVLDNLQSGLDLMGEVRHIELLNGRNKNLIAFVRNNESTKIYSISK